MPSSSKRRKSKIDEDEGVPPKKSKNNNPMSYKWEYEQQAEKWVEIKTTAASQLEKAAQDNVKKVNISLSKNNAALVDVEKMKCTGKNSNEAKNMRYCILDQQAWMVWSWKDMNNDSISYFPAHISKQLESAYSENKNQDVAFKLSQRKYEINTSTMKMMNSKKIEVAAVNRRNIDDKEASAEEHVISSQKSKVENEACKKTGVAVVDPVCVTKVNTAHVFKEDNVVWDAMLNQTNIQFNNNKFYKLQLLEDNNSKHYSVWFHWGRVGKPGQNKLNPCGNSLDEAKKIFEQKFFDKTKNSWSDQNNFVKVDGKYDLVIIDFSAEKKMADRVKELPPPPESKLPKQLQLVMELIFNVQGMENAAKELQYDINRSPLGNLTNKQLAAGYEALTEIAKLIKNNQARGKALLSECNKFYTRIPHYFGMKTPPLIQTLSELKKKIDLMNMLGDIKEAMKIVDEEVLENLNPTDSHYESLHCKLEILDSTNSDYKTIKHFLMTTHAKLHQRYTMELLDIFVCERENESKNFHDVGNKMLLWHGSRVANFGGILSQGLRVAPSEAPVNGYMFGKGIYFADSSSKCANYCYSSKKNDIGLLLLSEVALGNQEKLIAATDQNFKLPPGKHSVMGLGQYAPNSSTFTKLADGTVVPVGVETETNVTNPDGYTLRYNEYIVYNSNQVKMRYLLKVKFIYESFV